MNDLSPRERLKAILNKERVDRPAVICPGGMMNSATVDVMRSCGEEFPYVHSDADKMGALAAAVQRQSGFENFGIPYCMTIEAEVLGAEVDFGKLDCEPKIAKELFPSVKEVVYKDIPTVLRQGRMEIVAKAGYDLQKKNPDIPVVGSLTGPISTAASIVDPMTFLKELRKYPEDANRVIDYVTEFLVGYARMLVESGFPVITIADPTATGEILGPKMFGTYAVPYINKLVDAVHEAGAQCIVHICGRMEAVKKYLPEFRADAVSTDAMVALGSLKKEYNDMTVMGNMSTFALQFKEKEFITKRTGELIDSGIDIIAPACGLSTLTPVGNIAAMTERVRETRAQ